MKKFLAALQFLTAIPIRPSVKISDQELAQSMFYFPLVGALIGCALSLVYLIARAFLPHLAVCSLLIIAEVLITKALHLDGLIDTVDGLSGGKDAKSALAIMRQGRVGAFGVVGMVLVLLAKLTFLYSLPRPTLISALILMAAYGRWALVFSAYFYPYARKEGGIGEPFVDLVGRREMVASTAIVFIVSIILARWRTVPLISVTIGFLAAFNWLLKKKLGGVTGDTLGASCELIEVIALIILVVKT